MSRSTAPLLLPALVACLAAGTLVAGCTTKRERAPVPRQDTSAATPSAAETTRRMEEEARSMNQRFEEVKAGNLSDAEKEKAVSELLERQQNLQQIGEPPSPSSENAPPPPPP